MKGAGKVLEATELEKVGGRATLQTCLNCFRRRQRKKSYVTAPMPIYAAISQRPPFSACVRRLLCNAVSMHSTSFFALSLSLCLSVSVSLSIPVSHLAFNFYHSAKAEKPKRNKNKNQNWGIHLASGNFIRLYYNGQDKFNFSISASCFVYFAASLKMFSIFIYDI